MNKILLTTSILFFAASLLASDLVIVSEKAPIELKTFDVEILVETKVEKFDGSYIIECAPVLNSQKAIVDFVIQTKKAVKILNFEYLDASTALRDCPSKAVMTAKIRYLAE